MSNNKGYVDANNENVETTLAAACCCVNHKMIRELPTQESLMEDCPTFDLDAYFDPDELLKPSGEFIDIEDLHNAMCVILHCTGDNIDLVIGAADFWMDHHVHVFINFPPLDNLPVWGQMSETLELEDPCDLYYQGEGKWLPRKKLIELVQKEFDEHPDEVTVNDLHRLHRIQQARCSVCSNRIAKLRISENHDGKLIGLCKGAFKMLRKLEEWLRNAAM